MMNVAPRLCRVAIKQVIDKLDVAWDKAERTTRLLWYVIRLCEGVEGVIS